MPIWLSAILWKVLLPDAILWAREHGYFNFAEELAAKGAVAVAAEIKDLKIYGQYPQGPNNPFAQVNDAGNQVSYTSKK